MLTCPAEDCNFRAATDRVLSTHVRQCKKAAAGLASVARELDQHEADQRQAKRRKISSFEPLEVVPEAEEPMDIDLEVSVISNWPKGRQLTL